MASSTTVKREVEKKFVEWSDGSITILTRTFDRDGTLSEYSNSTTYTTEQIDDIRSYVDNVKR